MIIFCSDASASADTGVAGVRTSSSCRRYCTVTSLALENTGSMGGFGISLRTRSGLKGTSPQAAKPALMFFAVNAVSPSWTVQGGETLLTNRIDTGSPQSVNLFAIG